jgi:hypothetical protein
VAQLSLRIVLLCGCRRRGDAPQSAAGRTGQTPFLNVELPLTAFFILGRAVFFIVHGYVLLHFVMLAGKAGPFDKALSDQIADDNRRTRLCTDRIDW